MSIEIKCAYDKMVSIEKLKPHPKNPNRHPDAQVELLVKLIKHHGWRVPVTVSNLSGLVIRGHGRLEAAIKLGLKKVPVDYQDYTSESEELADLIADNKSDELSFLDNGMLKTVFEDLSGFNFNLELTGFQAYEVRNMFEQNGNEQFDYEKEWQNMPEFIQPEASGVKIISVHFASLDAVQDFANLINQQLTIKTRAIWFPSRARQNLKSLIIKDES